MLRKARALIGHMSFDQAKPLLRGPQGRSEEDDANLREVWQQRADAVAARGQVELVNPVTQLPTAVAEHVEQFRRRSDVVQLFTPHDWWVGGLDLRKPILSYQTLVHVDDALERAGKVDITDADSLFKFCLPDVELAEIPGGFDPTQNAFTLSSLNPNLRIASFEIVELPAAAGATKRVVGFTLSLGGSFIQVVEYRDRWMVRDGYHRLYGLLARGAAVVPCICIRARSFDETGAGRPGFFGFETLYSTNPPLLSDFMDDSVSFGVDTTAVRKVVRIRAEEFVVPI